MAVRTCRYTETGERFSLTLWTEADFPPPPYSIHGTIGTRPDWLAFIVTLARMGRHHTRIFASPPDLLVWFEINDADELVRFIDLDE
jgi:hypothetical protein